ncbi:MAG: diaminopimelate epimerase [Thermomicrobiaceae bacterium]|nr:diaminopimelate epimerase [Thermomicrobiaceae bacterium]
MSLPFVKLSGAGNDFIALAEADCRGYDLPALARALCARALSLGADGLIVVGPADGNAARIRFYNPDGSLAEMCGNGSRCAARYARERGLVRGDRFRLRSDSGDLDVVARPDGRYEVAMPAPSEPRFDLLEVEEGGERWPVHALRVGVPHAVVVAPDVERLADEWLVALGRALRHHPAFPDGTNVNVVTLLADGAVRQRTYERGVEALTKACGTGATATAVVATARYGRGWPVEVRVDGGRLTVDLRDGRPWLIGDARLIASGVVGPDALAW